jgi:AcrR family transcriptional regulator
MKPRRTLKPQFRPPGTSGLPLLSLIDQAGVTEERADAARNRARILDAARKLLSKRGIEEICMDALAKAAGVGKGTLYRRFVDRSSLCRALIDDSERQLQERVLRGFDLSVGTGAMERLERLLAALFDFVATNAPLLTEAGAFERSTDRHEHPCVAWRRAELARLIVAIQRDRDFPDADPHTLAEFLLAPLDPGLVTFQLTSGAALTELREMYIRFCMRAVCGSVL